LRSCDMVGIATIRHASDDLSYRQENVFCNHEE
jgi:hypothetical protein